MSARLVTDEGVIDRLCTYDEYMHLTQPGESN